MSEEVFVYHVQESNCSIHPEENFNDHYVAFLKLCDDKDKIIKIHFDSTDDFIMLKATQMKWSILEPTIKINIDDNKMAILSIHSVLGDIYTVIATVFN